MSGSTRGRCVCMCGVCVERVSSATGCSPGVSTTWRGSNGDLGVRLQSTCGEVASGEVASTSRDLLQETQQTVARGEGEGGRVRVPAGRCC